LLRTTTRRFASSSGTRGQPVDLGERGALRAVHV
jgi:hypothetical protein